MSSGPILVGGVLFVVAAGLFDSLLGAAFEALVPVTSPARLEALWLRMALGFMAAGFLTADLLARVFLFGATCEGPMLLATCVAHSPADGPGSVVSWGATLGLLGLGLGTAALFWPLPAFPRGRRAKELEPILDALGVGAAVELVAGDRPACFSEIVPIPRVVLVGGAETILTTGELAAALGHEAAHLRLGDHLARIVARAHRRLIALSGGPGLYTALVEDQEKRADDMVAARGPEVVAALRAALVKLSGFREECAPEATAASGPSEAMLRERLARLDGREGLQPPRPRRFPVWAALGLMLLVLAGTTDKGACALHCMIISLP